MLRQPKCRSAAGGQRARARARQPWETLLYPPAANSRILDAAEYPARFAESSGLLSTKDVDKSVEKQGSSTLSGRSISGPVQNGEKVSETQMKSLNSIDYDPLYIFS